MARFDFSILLTKDQTELTRLKTALEVYQSEDKYAFERNKFKTENVRLIWVALLTALISLGSSFTIESFRQSKTSRENVRKEFHELEKIYVESNSDRQQHLACEVARFDNEFSDKWISGRLQYYTQVCHSVVQIQTQNGKIAQADTSSYYVKSALKKIDSLEKQQRILEQQAKSNPQSPKSPINQEIKMIDTEINRVISETPQIESAVASSNLIQKNVTEIAKTNSIILNSSLNGSGIRSTISPTLWFKQGYLLHFGDYRVSLLELNKNQISVQVCKTTDNANCANPLIANGVITFDNPLEFRDENKSIRIHLSSVDHAGRNPFTLAAYIYLETIE